MNINDYKELIDKTAQYPSEVKNFGLAYAALGFYGELEEVKEKIFSGSNIDEVRQEIGDVLWYTAAICKEADLSFAEVIFGVIEIKVTDKEKPIAELIKKHYRDEVELDKKKLTQALINQLNLLFDYYFSIYETKSEEEEIEYIMELNKEKLLRRKANNTIKGNGDSR